MLLAAFLVCPKIDDCFLRQWKVSLLSELLKPVIFNKLQALQLMQNMTERCMYSRRRLISDSYLDIMMTLGDGV